MLAGVAPCRPGVVAACSEAAASVVSVPAASDEAAEPAAQILAAELGWDAERTRSEVEHYLRRVQAEIESQQMTEDERADAERTEATDIRTLAKG